LEEDEPMPVRTDAATDLAACQKAHKRLLATVSTLTDPQAHAPSRLPGWTVGHVLTHLARHADSVVRRLGASARDEVIDQYVGGPAGRAAAIEAGAGRSATALIDDVRSSAAALEAAIVTMPPDAWERVTVAVTGDRQPAWAVVHRRVIEVEIHHVDLGLGYEPGDWPAEFVAELLVDGLPALAGRADPNELLAWILGRGEAPELPPW
jgi:maleylpyruvate isomerase